MRETEERQKKQKTKGKQDNDRNVVPKQRSDGEVPAISFPFSVIVWHCPSTNASRYFLTHAICAWSEVRDTKKTEKKRRDHRRLVLFVSHFVFSVIANVSGSGVVRLIEWKWEWEQPNRILPFFHGLG